MTVAAARRKGRKVAFDAVGGKYWTDADGRILVGYHSACTICQRQTRWRRRYEQFYIPVCSRACERIRLSS